MRTEYQWSLTILAPGTSFMEDNFSMDQVEGVGGLMILGWFKQSTFIIQAKCIYYALYFYHCGSAGKQSACSTGHLGSILGLGRFCGEKKGYPLQYSGLENSMDCVDHEVAKSQTWLSDFHFHLFLLLLHQLHLTSSGTRSYTLRTPAEIC